MATPPHGVTGLLQAWGSGDTAALDQLVPIVYEELHRQAQRYLRGEAPRHTLQTTALVHEAYLRLVDQREARWQNRAHFFGSLPSSCGGSSWITPDGIKRRSGGLGYSGAVRGGRRRGGGVRG